MILKKNKKTELTLNLLRSTGPMCCSCVCYWIHNAPSVFSKSNHLRWIKCSHSGMAWKCSNWLNNKFLFTFVTWTQIAGVLLMRICPCLFILQQMEIGTRLIIFHKHDISENCDIKKKNQFLQYSSAIDYAKQALRYHCSPMKTCLDDCSTCTETVNMHYKDIKALTRQLLSSGQGFLVCVSC